MSILPEPRFPKLNQSVGSWAESAHPWQLRQWITECRSIEELFEFIRANKNKVLTDAREFDLLAQQQIHTLIAAQTHEQFQASSVEMKSMAQETHAHLMALRLPPVMKDSRTYVAFVSGALAGLLAGLLANFFRR